MGEVCLAEAGGAGEVHARRGESKRERAVRGRRRVKDGAVLETWAEGRPGHSKQDEELDWGRWMIGDGRCETLYEGWLTFRGAVQSRV